MIQENFAQRTKTFWEWFQTNEEKLSGRMGKHDQETLECFTEGVSLLSEDLHFNVGGDHEFTFAVSGNDALFFLLPYVTVNLPEEYQEKWTFFPCMQGTGELAFDFAMHGAKVNMEKVMVSGKPNQDERAADLRFYAKEWESLDDDQCLGAFYILMELSIGEALANACIIQVERAESLEDDMFPMTELKQWATEHLCEDGQIPDPAHRYFTYEKQPQEESLLREDILFGYGNYVPVLRDYDCGSDESYDTFAEFGAKPVFLYYYYCNENEGCYSKIVDERNEMMDRMEEQVLGQRGSGREIGCFLGSAIGERRVYLDVLLYDEVAFMEKARDFFADTPFMVFVKEFYRDGREFLLTDEHSPGFIGRLEQLADTNAPDEIIKIIQQVPNEKWDYVLCGILSRALNNMEEYQHALDVMELIRGQGETDPIWHYRRGYSLLSLDRVIEAETALLQAKELAEKGAGVTEWADELLAIIADRKRFPG